MKTFSVVEIFPTLQGEGMWAGRRAVFMRFAGCNLWNGIPEDRSKGLGACAMWCDTNFAKGEKMTTEEIISKLDAAWGSNPAGMSSVDCRMVVITGGEPTLQLSIPLVEALRQHAWFVAIETNGTNDSPVLRHLDHVCVSPKRGSKLQVWEADELKVVLPGGAPGSPPEHSWSDEELEFLAQNGRFQHLYVQPQDPTMTSAVELTYLHGHGDRIMQDRYEDNVRECMRFIERHPAWRLSLQQHKLIGIR
jgi:organic radical activating enzyme